MLSTNWYDWFAWYPVEVPDALDPRGSRWVWLCWVQRSDHIDKGGEWSEFRS